MYQQLHEKEVELEEIKTAETKVEEKEAGRSPDPGIEEQKKMTSYQNLENWYQNLESQKQDYLNGTEEYCKTHKFAHKFKGIILKIIISLEILNEFSDLAKIVSEKNWPNLRRLYKILFAIACVLLGLSLFFPLVRLEKIAGYVALASLPLLAGSGILFLIYVCCKADLFDDLKKEIEQSKSEFKKNYEMHRKNLLSSNSEKKDIHKKCMIFLTDFFCKFVKDNYKIPTKNLEAAFLKPLISAMETKFPYTKLKHSYCLNTENKDKISAPDDLYAKCCNVFTKSYIYAFLCNKIFFICTQADYLLLKNCLEKNKEELIDIQNRITTLPEHHPEYSSAEDLQKKVNEFLLKVSECQELLTSFLKINNQPDEKDEKKEEEPYASDKDDLNCFVNKKDPKIKSIGLKYDSENDNNDDMLDVKKTDNISMTVSELPTCNTV